MVSKTYTFTLDPSNIGYVLGPLRDALTAAMDDTQRSRSRRRNPDAADEVKVLHEVIKQITDSHMNNREVSTNASNSHD